MGYGKKALKFGHFLRKKTGKKMVLGVVFLLQVYYNVVNSGVKWIVLE